MQCVGNTRRAAASGNSVPVGSAAGIVPYSGRRSTAISCCNNDWWSYNGYLQDSYSRGRIRLNGGLRYDWQQSKHLGGCVPAERRCSRTCCRRSARARPMSDAVNGKTIQSFGNWSPRLSATYDLFGNGKTSVHASGSYYYATKITLANSLNGIFTPTALTWGRNQSSGAVQHDRRRTLLDRRQRRQLVQTNELIGVADGEQPALQPEHRRPQPRPATSSTRARRSAARARRSSACSTS